MDRSSILITTEGTYPHFGGGVSVWCDQLISQLPELDFRVFSIVPGPGLPLQFRLPGNVTGLHAFPLWGTPHAGLPEDDVAGSLRRRQRTTGDAIRREFLPHLRNILDGFIGGDGSTTALADGLAGLHRYARTRDYSTSMNSAEAWGTFLEAYRRAYPESRLSEATDCMRWLQRYLAVAAAEIPETDVVHATMSGLAGLPGVLAKITRGTPYMLTEHGLHMREMYASLSRGRYLRNARRFLADFHQALVRLNYRYADSITSLGIFNREWQIELGADPDKIRIVPNGVDDTVFKPRPASPRKRPTVLTLARIYPLKGIEPLLEAAAIVRDRVPDVLFRILGEVADEDYYERCLRLVVRHRLEHNVTFSVTREPEKAYCEADVYCLSSLSEAMPYVVLEAMMSGCPVVATEVGNVKEIVANTGLLVHPNNPGELAAALLETLSGEGAGDFRAFLAEAALERARKHYTLNHCVDRFREQYRELQHAETTATLSQAAR